MSATAFAWMLPALPHAAAARPSRPSAAAAATFKVNSTADFGDPTPDGVCGSTLGQCTLREAIQEANATPETDTIAFAITDPPPKSIQPATPLPAITSPVVIDGTTQPGYRSAPIVELNGVNAGAGADGLQITAGSSTVRGLVVNRFSGDGIEISSGGGNTIERNRIGTDLQGVLDEGNGGRGINIVDSSDNVVGAGGFSVVDLGNVISGNAGAGVGIVGTGLGNTVADNLIGTDATGAHALGNGGDGVFVRARGNRIGDSSFGGNVISANGRDGVHIQSGSGISADGNLVRDDDIGTDAVHGGPLGNGRHGVAIVGGASSTSMDENTIAFNLGDGVFIGSGTLNRVSFDRTHDNGGLGIDLGPDGVTPNDPGDGDGGANGLQNFPVLTAATPFANSLQVTGTLNSEPNTTYEVDLYLSPACDGTNGEGSQPTTGANVTTNGSGNASFAVTINSHVFGGQVVTATATSPTKGISEFSACLAVPFAHTFTVNTTADNGDATPDGACNDGTGHCSLREALQEANAAAGEDLVAFGIPVAGVHTITPAGALPPLTDRATVDGTTQPGFAGTPLIELKGSSAGSGTDGLVISAGPSVIRGLAVNRFPGDGIEISQGSGNVIQGNFIGTDTSGTTDLGNNGNGLRVGSSANTIGGQGAENVISGNQANGVLVAASSNFLKGNFIGTDVSGTQPLGNAGDGVQITSNNVFVGGFSSGPPNVISANGGDGVEIKSVVSSVAGNLIGTDVAGTVDLGNGGDGVRLSGSGDANSVRGNVISGNGFAGVEISQIVANPGSTPNSVFGNLIGVSADGSSALPNLFGVRLIGTTDVAVGLPGRPGFGNVVSGNSLTGIDVTDSSDVLVQANVVGLGADGLTAVPNTLNGISLSNAFDVTIGETGQDLGNVVSGNGQLGIRILNGSHDVTLLGNFIGTDATGTVARENALEGLVLSDAHDNVVGGTTQGAGNVISGNGVDGLQIHEAGSTGNQVLGNVIGLDATRTVELGNGEAGVHVFASASGNVVGGTVPGAGNLIRGNGQSGVELGSGGTEVLGNLIGRAGRASSQPVGVSITGAGNFVGGLGQGEANSILGNGKGVVVTGNSATGNRIRGNVFSGNTGLAIDLDGNGVTSNDDDDVDTGPNQRQNFPTLTGAVGSAGSTTVQGFMDGAPGQTIDLDLYAVAVCDSSGHGEADRFLGTTSTTTNGTGIGPIVTTVGPLRPGEFVTATATDGSGNTSEFSTCVRSLQGGGGSVSADFDGDGFADLAVGIPGEEPQFSAGLDSGAVIVIPGSATGLDPAGAILLQQGSGGGPDSPEPGDRFGSALAAGDFDGDGLADLAVGVPGEDVGAVVDAGAVNVIFGSGQGLGAGPEQFLTQDTPGILETAGKGDAFGSALAAANFGVSSEVDLAVGVPGERVGTVAGAGAVNVIYGSAGGLSATGDQVWTQDTTGIVDTAEPGDAFGFALAAKNLGKSGQADLAVGVPGEDLEAAADAGVVNVIYGTSAGLDATGNQRWSQNSSGVLDDAEAGDGFGSALAAGDMGNGAPPDLAVGVPGEDLAGFGSDDGAVNVIYGTTDGLSSASTQLWTEESPGILGSAATGNRFGTALAARNLGNSGEADLAIGVPGEDAGAGAVDAGTVNVIYGTPGGLSDAGNQRFLQGDAGLLDSPEQGDGFGASLTVGNFGNGTESDVAIGVPGEDVSAGAVAVVFGTAGGLDDPGNQILRQGAAGLPETSEPGDRFGQAVG